LQKTQRIAQEYLKMQKNLKMWVSLSVNLTNYANP
jgi:hypothetical protein